MPSIKVNSNLNSLTDKELINLVSQKVESALNELMLRYKHKLYAFILRYVKDEDVAYDIVQETFIRIYFKADSYRPAYKFSTWLFQIAINLCRDWSRKQKTRRAISLDETIGDNNAILYDIIEDKSHNIEDNADIRQQLQFIDAEIKKLPHKLKTALIMFALEENSQDACAELLDVTVKTIETRVYRARKILSEKLIIFLRDNVL